MRSVVYVNGVVTGAPEAVIPVFDHGFLYGEGIYETLRTYDREPFLFDRHLHRLRHSAELMALPVPVSDGELLARVRQTLAAAYGPLDSQGVAATVQPEAYIRILLTRGVGELTYNPAACPVPSLVIIVKALPVYAEQSFTEGIRVSLVSVRRNHRDALNPMIKSNNLLNNALAMQEALRRGGEEALMLNQEGEIVECAQSNVFLVKGGTALTPPLTAGLLPGITREFVLEIAKAAGIPAREARITPGDLATADELFLTGTTREITPIVHVDDQRIGTGRTGDVTRRLLTEFRRRVRPSTARA